MRDTTKFSGHNLEFRDTSKYSGTKPSLARHNQVMGDITILFSPDQGHNHRFPINSLLLLKYLVSGRCKPLLDSTAPRYLLFFRERVPLKRRPRTTAGALCSSADFTTYDLRQRDSLRSLTRPLNKCISYALQQSTLRLPCSALLLFPF